MSPGRWVSLEDLVLNLGYTGSLPPWRTLGWLSVWVGGGSADEIGCEGGGDMTAARCSANILTSARRCFSRDGFHATSIEDVIAATGMSSSAVYRYFRSKEEIIRASAEIGVARVRDINVALLDREPCPTPAETLALLVDELHARTDNPEYDMCSSSNNHDPCGRYALAHSTRTFEAVILFPRVNWIGQSVLHTNRDSRHCEPRERL